MKYLRFFLREQKKNILLVCGGFLIFGVVFFLGNVPVEIAGYGFLLCIAFFCAMYALLYIRYYRSMEQLQQVSEEMLVTLERLPEADTGKEYVYQEMLNKFRVAYDEQIENMYLREQDSSEYNSMWAHQIKVPIAAMHLILQEEHSPELEYQLFRIGQYVQMILNYQRLNGTINDFVPEEQPLDPMIRQVIRKFRRLFIRKKIALDYRETSLVVLSDEKWLCFVLEQVLSNALKYTKTGKIEIFTEGSQLFIRDTGIGIRPEDLPRIFERGYTGYNGRADKKSTGIGLYLCKRVCDKLGHGIRVESEVGVGTTVCLSLDFANVDVSP